MVLQHLQAHGEGSGRLPRPHRPIVCLGPPAYQQPRGREAPPPPPQQAPAHRARRPAAGFALYGAMGERVRCAIVAGEVAGDCRRRHRCRQRHFSTWGAGAPMRGTGAADRKRAGTACWGAARRVPARPPSLQLRHSCRSTEKKGLRPPARQGAEAPRCACAPAPTP